MLKIMTVVALCYALVSHSVFANNYIIDVHGIVCEFCSLGVAKNVRRLSFIDSNQFDKGVKVDIKNQAVFIGVRDDAVLDQQALFKAIEAGGYSPVKIWQIDLLGEKVEFKQ
jgi:hypothetical protein